MPGEGIPLNVQMVLLVHEIVGRNATHYARMIETLVVIPPLLVGDTSIRALELHFTYAKIIHLLPLAVFRNTLHAQLASKAQIKLVLVQTELGVGLAISKTDEHCLHVHRVQHHHVAIILAADLRIVLEDVLPSQRASAQTASFT